MAVPSVNVMAWRLNSQKKVADTAKATSKLQIFCFSVSYYVTLALLPQPNTPLSTQNWAQFSAPLVSSPTVRRASFPLRTKWPPWLRASFRIEFWLRRLLLLLLRMLIQQTPSFSLGYVWFLGLLPGIYCVELEFLTLLLCSSLALLLDP